MKTRNHHSLRKAAYKRPALHLFLAALLLPAGLSGSLLAQKPAGAKKGAAANQVRQKTGGQQAEAQTPEAEPIPRYTAMDRRDPFQNLANLQVKPTAPRIIGPPPLSQRPPGLGGLLISEVSVIGTAQQAGKKIVVLRGTDKFTYMAREGTKLYDGVLEEIEGDQVTFERIVRDTAGNEISSKVVKH